MKLKAIRYLKEYFGYESFRAGQELIINSVLDKKNTLGIMPTGGGKSLCYQIPALCFDGLTIVISPLISLMKDQIDHLHSVNYPAEMINSSVSYDEQFLIKEKLENKKVKLLYLTPERFKNKNFLTFLKNLKVDLFVVDEAHCISEWGHDFRPEYRKLSGVIDAIGKPTILALTATATSIVKDDIINSLKMKENKIFVTGFNRDNLFYSVKNFFSVKDKNLALTEFINNNESPGIIYSSSVKDAENVFNYLKTNSKKNIGLYHGGLPVNARKNNQEDFLNGRKDILVATNAFGMGINKSNIRFVVHYTIPGSIEAYYQETGRAGRDGKNSSCMLFAMDEDESIQEFFIRSNNPGFELLLDSFKILKKEIKKRRIYLDEINEIFKDKKTSGHVINAVVKQLHYFGVIDFDYISKDQIEATILKFPEGEDKENLRELFSDKIFSNNFISFPKDFILKRAGLSEEEFYKSINELVKKRIISYVLVRKGNVIKLLKDEIDDKIKKEYQEKLKVKMEFDKNKLRLMTDYAKLSTCRRKYLLGYFGEEFKLDNCVKCDVCLGTNESSKGIEINDIHKEMLLFFLNHNSKIGKVKSLKILSGSYEIEPYYREWDEYGRLRKYNFKNLEDSFNELLKAKLIEIEKGKYSVVKFTKQGHKELKFSMNSFK